MVPKGWELTTVGSACNIKNNLRLPISSEEREKVVGDYPYFGPTGILGYINEYKIDEEFALIGEDGDHFLKHKEKEMTLMFAGKANVNNHAHIIANSDKCLVSWFHAYFVHRDISSHLTRQGAKRYKLTKAALEKLEILIPPYAEQKKIAKILSVWDKAIATTEQLLAVSQQQKKALMQKLLTGKVRLLDENGVRFEGEWKECLVSDYFDVGSSKRVLQEDWKTEGAPFYRTRELVSLSKNEPFRSEIFISDELFLELSEKYGLPKSGDFLVSGVGTLGISYQVKEGDRFYFKDGNVLWFKIKNGIDSDYFKYCFQSDFMQDQITAQASITTVGTYTIQNAKKTKFWCPEKLEEQQKIASVLSAAERELLVLKRKLDALKQEKKALMQTLLTGKRRVRC